MDLKEKIKVMQAYQAGFEIEFINYRKNNAKWEYEEFPNWDWENEKYRIKNKKQENSKMKCPFKRTVETTYQGGDGKELTIKKESFGECEEFNCMAFYETEIGSNTIKRCIKLERGVKQ